jgi:DmsE family decaheme c-type cytochrome
MRKVKFLTVAFIFLFVAAGVFQQKAAEGATKAAGAELCKDCHEAQYDSYLKSKHSKKGFAEGPANQSDCIACHKEGEAHAEAGGGKGTGGIVSLNGKNVPAATKDAVCISCHASSKNLAFWDMGAHKKNDVACISCHNIHGKKISQVETCTGCHKDVKKDINRSASHHPIVEGKVKCSDCHNPHGTLSHGMIKAENTNQLCYTCHPNKRGPWLWEHAPVEENCITCHTPHGSRVSKLLTQRLPNLCTDCHVGPDHHKGNWFLGKNGFEGASPNVKLFARACNNCHNAIHGSNHPENPSNNYSSGRYLIR